MPSGPAEIKPEPSRVADDIHRIVGEGRILEIEKHVEPGSGWRVSMQVGRWTALVAGLLTLGALAGCAKGDGDGRAADSPSMAGADTSPGTVGPAPAGGASDSVPSAAPPTPAAGAKGSAPAGTTASAPAPAALYTAAQAVRGEEVYTTSCAQCHTMAQHSGGAFATAWNDRRVFDLYDIVHNTMPLDNPGGLSDQEYIDVVAYMLKLNGMPAGKSALPTDAAALKEMRIAVKPTAGQ
jgi:mono/diheme cytochrome c family protein